MKEFVLSLAPTGIIPDKSMTPYVPITSDEVVSDVLDCAAYGLTYAHIHARDDRGLPTASPDVYQVYIEKLRNALPEMPVCVSCSGRVDPSFEARSRVLDLPTDLRPDMASLTLSSLNFSRSASINAPDTVVRLVGRMQERGIVPELEVFDVGMLNYALYLIDRGHLQPPYYFNIMLGNIASAQVDLLHLATVLRDIPEGALWSVGGIGASQLKANVLALVEGGGIRTGLEDNIWFDENQTRLATNADLVKRCAALALTLEKYPMPPQKFKHWLKQK